VKKDGIGILTPRFPPN